MLDAAQEALAANAAGLPGANHASRVCQETVADLQKIRARFADAACSRLLGIA
jgi:hypothetical protein